MLKQRNCDFSFAGFIFILIQFLSFVLNAFKIGLKNAFRLLVSDVRKSCGVNTTFNNAPSMSLEEVPLENVVVIDNKVNLR